MKTKVKTNAMLVSYFFSMVFSGPLLAENTSPSPKDYQAKASEIVSEMSLDEKVGQLLLPTYALLITSKEACKTAMEKPRSAASDKQVIEDCGLNQIAQYKIGSVLQDGGPYVGKADMETWIRLNSLAQEIHKKNVKKDPLLLTGNDAIHGNNHAAGAVIFPHNIGLGVTHDTEMVRHIGELVAKDSLYAGFNWVYMPTVAVAQDLRWGRTYESFSQEPSLVKALAKSYIEGFQQGGAMATVKHFIGDGATDYGIDEGDATFNGSPEKFWQIHGQGYNGALEANVYSMMISYNAINGKRMHFGGPWDSINDFKNRKGFYGFVVSDFNGVTRAEYFEKRQRRLPEVFADSLNAGMDMFMVGNWDLMNPFDPTSPYYCKTIGDAVIALKTAVNEGLISKEQLNKIVVRILTTKLAALDNMNNEKMQKNDYDVLQKKQRAIALKAAEKSLVLLQNKNNLLPLKSKKLKYILIAGPVDDLGSQNGGWTINWQGQKGDQYFTGPDKVSSGATTILEGIKKYFKGAKVLNVKEMNTVKDISPDNTLILTVVAEPPYAEYMGDIGNNAGVVDAFYEKGAAGGENEYMKLPQSTELKLDWANDESKAIMQLRQKEIPVVSIVYSGRPVVLTNVLQNSDAVIAAFLPGTLGGDAIANALMGKYLFRMEWQSNTLTFPWPRNMADVENRFKEGSLYPIGYGLATQKK
jgi:beta-glucosidase